jgi:hypothetical protein
MTLSSDLNSVENGGGVVAVVKTVEDANAANTAVENSGNGDNLTNIANTLGQVNSMVGQAEGGGASGGGSVSGGSSGAGGTAACSSNGVYMMYMTQCKSNPLSQAPCYQAAAALCQCYVNADPTNPSVASWRQCVTNNTNSANALRSNAPTVN